MTIICRIAISTCCILLAVSVDCSAQNGGFDILSLPPDTKALGFNGASNATLLGSAGLFINPANLTFESSSSLNASYSLWIGGLRNSQFSTHLKRKRSSLAFGLLASEADDFQLRDRPGPSRGSFAVSYLAMAGAYAYRYKNISAGLTFHYLREELYIHHADGYAFNAGLSSQWIDRRLRISASAQNIGRMTALHTSPTKLPSTLRIGFEIRALEFAPPGNNDLPVRIMLLADYVESLNKGEGASAESYLNAGVNIALAGVADLRAGYKSGDTERPLSFGLGLNMRGITLNYALVPFKTGFGTVHSIGLAYRF